MTPLDKVRAAVAHMEVLGIRILHGDWGVLRGELSGEWIPDPARRPMGVSPLGAVLVHLQQPDPRRGPMDVPDAAAEALRVGIAWTAGFADGFDKDPQAYYLGGSNRQLYLAGLEAGMELRFELTVRCPCGTRHLRWEPCPLCEERRREGPHAA